MATIRFLLGDEERALDDVSPTLTVLEYLRRHERRTGTKEGCAEGDCGACTVVLSEPDGEGGLKHRAVNSCIQFVPVLHGRQLTTVEDLKARGRHAAPGAAGAGRSSRLAMRLLHAGLRHAALCRLAGGRSSTDRQAVKDWLAGNLCRCTGYGPIIEAGLEAARTQPPSEAALASNRGAADAAERRRQCCISRIGDAHGLRAALGRRACGGLPAASRCGARRRRDRRRAVGDQAAPALEDFDRCDSRQRSFAFVEEREDGLTIGATVSHRDATAALARLHPDLGELMRRFASIQIRNAGTVGGNIANGSPIGDLPPALIALDARLTLRRGVERREIPLEDFFIAYGKQDRAPGEFVESVFVPALAADHALRLLQALQALRPGHFRGDGRVPGRA